MTRLEFFDNFNLGLEIYNTKEERGSLLPQCSKCFLSVPSFSKLLYNSYKTIFYLCACLDVCMESNLHMDLITQ